ncbi:MAG TPA: hypothetical protein VKR52_19505 [Terracidiphilus sp.]|nr:hypothetical protein [Terracidiphilus sp.]
MANPPRRTAPACLVLAFLAITIPAVAQDPGIQLPEIVPGLDKSHNLFDQYPDHPSQNPVFSIPASPLGYSVPGPIYETRLDALVSLDFLDEDHLLFTFHVPGGLMQRSSPGSEESERHIRAVVVSLPSGKIEAQETWELHDRLRYLWMLRDGHFLLRDAGGLQEGDASLKLKPFVQFDGHLLWLEMDPTKHFLMTNSVEPASAPVSAKDAAESASASASGDPPATLTIRTLNLPSGEVFRTSRVPWTYQTSDLPMNFDGYLEVKGAGKRKWSLNLSYFAGGGHVIASVPSTCAPQGRYISHREMLVTTCDPLGGWKLIAMMVNGWYRWTQNMSTNGIWPLLVMSPDGSWIARETLILNHPLNGHNKHYSMQDVRGQLIRVINATNGNLMLEVPVKPLLLSGGNVAFSPSGKRVAILNEASIEVFNLPAPSSSPND